MNAFIYDLIKGSYGIRVTIFAVFILSAVNIIFAILRTRKRNMYSYRIMYYIGGLVFVVFNIFLFGYLSIVDRAHGFDFNQFMIYIFNSCTYFIVALLPLIFIFAIVIAISNFILIKKEGGGIRNLLGIGLALVLIGGTLIILFVSIFSPFDNRIEFVVETVLFGLLSYFECIMIGTFIATFITHRSIPPRDRDYVIILGCGLREDGTPIPILEGRIDKALWFAKKQLKETGKDIVYVCSGGQGDDEIISEGESIRNYLVEKGVKEDKIIIEDKSTSTYENMLFSKEQIDKYQEENGISEEEKIAFSTTDYHVYRSGNIAYSIGVKALGMGSKTKRYFYINALIREFAANIKAQRVRHIINVIVIVALYAIFHIVNYMYYNV